MKNETQCKRCGTCCLKGGPALHIQDISLVTQGILLKKHLYTLRKGELVRDNVAGTLIPLESEIIKLKGQGDSWTCIFFNNKTKTCGIYKNRPVECEALKCWDTKNIEKLYNKDRLTRKDLIPQKSWLWDMIQEHEDRCSYLKINELRSDMNTEQIREIERYDFHLRDLLVKKAGMKLEDMNFLFGRPLKLK